eukprot:COSAG02_NODE_23_length_52893_cov_58.101868_58_plen_107_part_00
MTTVRDGTPNFTPGDTYIYSNVWLCSYFSGWALDHDDASSYYTDLFNFLLYGGVKTNMLGAHNKTFGNNFIFRPGDRRPSAPVTFAYRRCKTTIALSQRFKTPKLE